MYNIVCFKKIFFGSNMEDLREVWRLVLWLYYDFGKKWQVIDLNQRVLRNFRGGKGN